MRHPLICLRLLASVCILGCSLDASNLEEDYPIVPDDLEVTLFATDPLVRNPCALAFDARGRLYVGMGPQYRKPKPDTPGDSVWRLVDQDGDGVAEEKIEFCGGLNAIQGMAWRGDDLWIANAPDLTVARDLDGDGRADAMTRLYSDLGNLEHGLHGLNWGPDGKLYMSKGNSKGLSQPPERVAPRPFRELWGVDLGDEAPDFPEPVEFDAAQYEKRYHHPSDDWGLMGGILRCDPDGAGLEIVARGFRNPWDIAYDDGFDWLGTDNDQTLGDKIFSPFYGAHFGWGHPWSYDWKGDDHLPSAPSSGPLFEGSGTGVLALNAPGYPERMQNVFLIADWLRREILIYRPQWDGAWMRATREPLERFAHAGGGRSMGLSAGRRFDPVDLELGPDGAVYISSWGRQYGAEYDEDGAQINEGRIYRIAPKGMNLPPMDQPHREQPHAEWTTEQLLDDLQSLLPARRIAAQEALIERGKETERQFEFQRFVQAYPPHERRRAETWMLWTQGRMGVEDVSLDRRFRPSDRRSQNANLQSLRILAYRQKARGDTVADPSFVSALEAQDARLRQEAVLALHQLQAKEAAFPLMERTASESDRVVYYALWKALCDLATEEQRRTALKDIRSGVRKAALLSLLEEDALDESEIAAFTQDPDSDIAQLARKRLGGKAQTEIRGAPLVAADAPERQRDIPPSRPRVRLRSPGEPFEALTPLNVSHSLRSLRANTPSGSFEEATLQERAFAFNDRPFTIEEIPESLLGLTFIRGLNEDADPRSGVGMELTLRYPSTVYLADDMRGEILPRWARGVFEPTEDEMVAGDARYRIYRAQFPAGPVHFGPNRDGVQARKGNYIVIISPDQVMNPEGKVTAEAVLPRLADADLDHGRNLFFQKTGAQCSSCHRLEGRGFNHAPDLTDIGQRADAAFLIRSILQPSADITEGFAQHVVILNNGNLHAGVLLVETGREVTLARIGAEPLLLNKNDIAERKIAEVSAMPEGYDQMLGADDAAALVAYLLGGASSAPQSDESPVGAFQWRSGPERIELLWNDTPITRFVWRDDAVWRPYFAGLRSLAGVPLTRPYPPGPDDPDDHPSMHPGLSLGFAVMDGVNFWHNREGRVEFVAMTREPETRGDGQSARFGSMHRYVDVDGIPLALESLNGQWSLQSGGWMGQYDYTLTAQRDLEFGVKEEMGLALRVATSLTVKYGEGRIQSATGGIDEEGTWGKVDRWWDYGATLDGRRVGLMLMSHPDNPPVWAHSRDYGVLVANPFPVDIKKNREIKTPLPKDTALELRFGLWAYDLPADTMPDLQTVWRSYLKQAERASP